MPHDRFHGGPAGRRAHAMNLPDVGEMPRVPSRGRRALRAGIVAALGAGLGALAWILLAAVLPALPVPARFLITLGLFLFGPGAILAGLVSRGTPSFDRAIILMAFGVAVAPALAEVLARLGLEPVFPFLASMAAGATLASWGAAGRGEVTGRRHTLVAAVVVALLMAAAGAIAFAHRLQTTSAGTVVSGEYDSVDLSYYAAITAEASHQIPPAAPFYSGHPLNYSYYPQVLLALVHRFGGVPILEMYFRYAWPAFLVLSGLTVFCFVRLIASDAVAALAAALMFLAGDLSYLGAWLLPHATYEFDYVIWPSNFLSTTAEVCHFSTWTPSFPVIFAALYALRRHERAPRPGWLIAAAVATACLVQFKTFAFAVMLGGLAASALIAPRDPAGRRRHLLTAAGGVALALPFFYRIAALYAESRGHLKLDFFLLQRRMLLKLDLAGAFDRLAGTVAPGGWLHEAAVLGPAVVLFFALGVGIRWLGVPRALRALASSSGTWRLLGWMVIAGTAIPFVIVTDPYHDTLQFYQTALYILSIFTAAAIMARAGTPGRRAALVALVFACALPSPIHYLARKWQDQARPLAELSRGEQAIDAYLRGLDPDRTVILHDRPLAASLVAIDAERRVVLAWGRYVRGSETRQGEVEAFFSSADRDPAPALDLLRRYGVTHVINRPARDRIHPAVLSRLRLVIEVRDAQLYAVPEASETRAPGP
jgi:hypothetical protein